MAVAVEPKRSVMSLVAMSMNAGQRLAVSAVLAVTDPDATAPAELQAKTNLVLGMVKWGSLMAVLGLFLAAGMISLAGDRGYGGGMSPEFVNDPAASESFAQLKTLLDDVNIEDRGCTEKVYRGLCSDLAKPGPLSHLERPNYDFARYLADRIGQ